MFYVTMDNVVQHTEFKKPLLGWDRRVEPPEKNGKEQRRLYKCSCFVAFLSQNIMEMFCKRFSKESNFPDWQRG